MRHHVSANLSGWSRLNHPRLLQPANPAWPPTLALHLLSGIVHASRRFASWWHALRSTALLNFNISYASML